MHHSCCSTLGVLCKFLSCLIECVVRLKLKCSAERGLVVSSRQLFVCSVRQCICVWLVHCVYVCMSVSMGMNVCVHVCVCGCSIQVFVNKLVQQLGIFRILL